MELDSNRIGRRFLRSLGTYEEGASVQRDVIQQLLARVDEVPSLQCNRVLEIGCGTGQLTAEFCAKRYVGEMYLNDLLEDFCLKTAGRILHLTGKVHLLAGNIEETILPEHLDLVLSSSTFQWLKDLPALLDRCATSLVDSGVLAFSLFGPGTMQEIRELLGVGLRYLPQQQILDHLSQKFTCLEAKQFIYKPYFSTPRQVLRHIQQTGVGGIVSYRWTRSRLRDFEEKYLAMYGEEQGVPLSYHALTFVAQKNSKI